MAIIPHFWVSSVFSRRQRIDVPHRNRSARSMSHPNKWFAHLQQSPPLSKSTDTRMRCQQNHTNWFWWNARQNKPRLQIYYRRQSDLVFWLFGGDYYVDSTKLSTLVLIPLLQTFDVVLNRFPRDRLIVCSFWISFGVKNSWLFFFLNRDFKNFFKSLSCAWTPFDAIFNWKRLVNLALRINIFVLRRWFNVLRLLFCSLWIFFTAWRNIFWLGSVPFTDLILIPFNRFTLADVIYAFISIALFVSQLNNALVLVMLFVRTW